MAVACPSLLLCRSLCLTLYGASFLVHEKPRGMLGRGCPCCAIMGGHLVRAGKKPGRRQKKSGRDYLDDDDDVDFKRAANGSIIKRVVPRSSCAPLPLYTVTQ